MTRTILIVVGVLLLVGSGVAAPLAAAQQATPAPTTPTTAAGNSTPTNSTLTNSTANQSGGGLLGGLVGGVGDVLRKFGVDQPIQAIVSLGGDIVKAATFTPHANNADSWFHDPSNGVWAENWDEWQNKGFPLWALLVIAGGVLGIGLRAAGMMSVGEFKEWRKRWVVGLVVGRWAWELGNLYLFFLGGLKAWFVADLTAGGRFASAWAPALILVLVVILAVVNLWIVVLIAGVVGMTIVGIDILTPYLGAMIAARGVPLRFVNGPGDKLSRFWAILPVLTLPMAIIVSAGFSTEITAIIEANGFSDAMIPFVHLGAFMLALISPYLVWSGASSTTAFSVGFAGGSVAMSQRYENAKQSARKAGTRGKQGVRGVRDVTRGARGKAPVADGGRGYDAGTAVRQSAAGARSKGWNGHAPQRFKSSSQSAGGDGRSERAKRISQKRSEVRERNSTSFSDLLRNK